MTETHILIFGFVITFGLLGYKLKGLVCKVLDDYSKKIEADVNKSELIKKQSIKELDDANKNADEIKKNVFNKKEEAQKKLDIIKVNIDKKTKNTINDIVKNQQFKINNEIDVIMVNFKKNISVAIKDVIDYFVKNNSSTENIDKVKSQLIEQANIKKLLVD